MTILPFTESQWKGVQLSSKEDAKATHDQLQLRAGPKTDWWRSAKGSVPESDVDRHDGPLFVFDAEDSLQTWTASVWIAVEHKERFQQATLFIGQGDYQTNKEPWLKAGVEIEDEKQNIGSVVAQPISDWALFPVPRKVSQKQGEWLFIEAKRNGADIILSYSIGSPNQINAKSTTKNDNNDCQKHLMREIKGFAKSTGKPWQIGVMTCGPMSEETRSVFHSFSFSKDG